MQKERIDGDRIFLIHDFFSAATCEAHVARSEELGYEEATITTARGALMRKDVRNNNRLIVDSTELARSIFALAREHLPAELGSMKLHGLNERFRYYRYDPGQTFKPHMDGSFIRSEQERSLVTLMVYLNDDYTGGSTRFFDQVGSLHAEISPRRGMALAFEHFQLHEGAPVLSGRKYVLRTDVMYRSEG